MGALAGWVTTSRRARDEGALGPMLEAIAHRCTRGEDLCGLADHSARRQVVLGTTLRDEASGISLALDGAIANAQELHPLLEKHGYPFKEKTHAEVLLRAYQHWDKDVVKQLRGAFAFAVWDARKERLLLARDRFGEKPLFLREHDGALYFASEIKALLRAPAAKPELDLRSVSDCLVYGYVPGPQTLFSGIRKLRTSGMPLRAEILPALAAALIGESGGTYQTIGRVRYSGWSGKATFHSIAIFHTGECRAACIQFSGTPSSRACLMTSGSLGSRKISSCA